MRNTRNTRNYILVEVLDPDADETVVVVDGAVELTSGAAELPAAGIGTVVVGTAG